MNKLLIAVAIVITTNQASNVCRAELPLVAQKPILVSGGAGSFDWMAVDGKLSRLYACHKGTGTLTILDLKTEKVLPAVKVGAAQGVAFDAKGNKIFIGNSTENNLIILDRSSFKKIGELKLDGPVDDIVFNTKNNLLYADNDDGTKVWAIDCNDSANPKIVATVTIPSGPEYVEYSTVTNRLYQNIKTNDTVQVINPETQKVEAQWKTGAATGPHGLAIDNKNSLVFSAGKTGKLVVMDMKTGVIKTTVDIKSGVDQIAYDRSNKRLYCACKDFISVVEIAADGGAKLLADVPSPAGSHTLAIDRASHSVWVCYADKKDSYLQKFTVPGLAQAKE